TSTLPARFSAPADCSASSDAPPDVQLKTSSPKAAASANVPLPAASPAAAAHSTALSFSAEREPILTSCPTVRSLLAIACPTTPSQRPPFPKSPTRIWPPPSARGDSPASCPRCQTPRSPPSERVGNPLQIGG